MPKVALFSLYCFKSFPIRIFHGLAAAKGADPVSIFLKDSKANTHAPLTDKELEFCVDLIEREKPDLIGITVLAPYVETARKLIARLREKSNAPIIIGGKYPTLMTEESLELADYACKGEGERVFEEILDRLKNNDADLKGITGLWYKNPDGSVVDMGQQTLIDDLDQIPFPAHAASNMYFIEHDALSQTDPEADSSVIMVMAGRGCVYKCSYCVNAVLLPMSQGLGKFMRARTPESVVQEIKERLALLSPEKQKVASVYFVDEVFGVNKNWTRAFADIYPSQVGLPFFCEMVPKMIKDENIKLLASIGLRELNFGIQTGNEDLRNGLFDRPGDDKEHIEKAHLLVQYGVAPRYDIILENPFETEEMLQKSLQMLLKLPKGIFMNVYKLQFFPGYPITKEALERGFVTQKELTHEAVAHTTMTNWAYKPKFVQKDKRSAYQNAIFILGRGDNWIVRAACQRLAASYHPVTASLVNALARYEYNLMQNESRIWHMLRRAHYAWELVRSGRLNELTYRVKRLVKA